MSRKSRLPGKRDRLRRSSAEEPVPPPTTILVPPPPTTEPTAPPATPAPADVPAPAPAPAAPSAAPSLRPLHGRLAGVFVLLGVVVAAVAIADRRPASPATPAQPAPFTETPTAPAEPASVLPPAPPLPADQAAVVARLREALEARLAAEPSVRRALSTGASAGPAALERYAQAALALDLGDRDESALRAWARRPGEALPARAHDALKRGRAALALLGQGAAASSLGAVQSASPALSRGLALGRLALAEGRHELAGGALRPACERGAAALQLAHDLAALGGEHARAGAALAREAVRALGAWLASPPSPAGGTAAEDVDAVALLLARLARGPAPSADPPELARAWRDAHEATGRLVELALRARAQLPSPERKP